MKSTRQKTRQNLYSNMPSYYMPSSLCTHYVEQVFEKTHLPTIMMMHGAETRFYDKKKKEKYSVR